jgi:hypothetical protein
VFSWSRVSQCANRDAIFELQGNSAGRSEKREIVRSSGLGKYFDGENVGLLSDRLRLNSKFRVSEVGSTCLEMIQSRNQMRLSRREKWGRLPIVRRSRGGGRKSRWVERASSMGNGNQNENFKQKSNLDKAKIPRVPLKRYFGPLEDGR